jgi:acetaldehyde dehydrogenase / alcohol dehydrogenase
MSSVNLILATGGPSMVNAAYSSGTPAIGVGAGNTPALLDVSCDIEMAVSSIIQSKAFDYGVICASEQSVIVPLKIYEKTKVEFIKRGAYFLSDLEIKKVKKIMLVKGMINAKIVGQSPKVIAKLAGIKIPDGTRIIIGEVSDTSLREPFAHEKLSVLLAMYKYEKFDEGVNIARNLVETGLGHTSTIFANEIGAADRVEQYYVAMKTCRVLVNQPASHGAIGDIYNAGLRPSLTLGCGT